MLHNWFYFPHNVIYFKFYPFLQIIHFACTMHYILNTNPVIGTLKHQAQDKQDLSLLGCYTASMWNTQIWIFSNTGVRISNIATDMNYPQ